MRSRQILKEKRKGVCECAQVSVGVRKYVCVCVGVQVCVEVQVSVCEPERKREGRSERHRWEFK